MGWEGSVLLALLLFVGVGAVYGGIGLMVNGLGMPSDWLDRMPVDTWTWPGLALLLSVAVPQFAAAWLGDAANYRAGLVGLVVGAALVLWILVQLAVLQRVLLPPARHRRHRGARGAALLGVDPPLRHRTSVKNPAPARRS